MVRKKKPFIDKKHATTYKLVHRSQHDPLIADEDANQMVLTEIPGAAGETKSVVDASRLELQRELGIYFNDDYDYMQHVRDKTEGQSVVWEAVNPTRAGKVELPMCVLPSVHEEPVGMLNLAAPRGLDLSLDPDIVAALDDDFDFENPDLELEDNFITMAEGAVLEEYGVGEDAEEQHGSGEEGEVDSLFSEEEDMCRFTEYSVSSSVLPRNDGLTMLDDRFEQMYKEYDVLGAGEEELKPVDELDVGNEPTMILEQLCVEFERQSVDDEDSVEVNKSRTLALVAQQAERPEKRENVVEEMDSRAAMTWDCETILSTYSNIYNHPKLIAIPPKIKLNKKGIVVDDIKEAEEENECENSDDGLGQSDEEENTVVISNYRTKLETAEEKKTRKKAVKENQRLRRQIKKATKEVFKEENYKEKQTNANKSGKVIKL